MTARPMEQQCFTPSFRLFEGIPKPTTSYSSICKTGQGRQHGYIFCEKYLLFLNPLFLSML